MQAMQRVGEIRARRERQFYRNRMAGNKQKELEADRLLVAENQHLLPPQYRDQAREVLEQVAEKEVEDMELELDPLKEKIAAKRKQRLVRGKGVEEMDVDE